MYRKTFNLKGQGAGLDITMILLVIAIGVAVWYFFIRKKKINLITKNTPAVNVKSPSGKYLILSNDKLVTSNTEPSGDNGIWAFFDWDKTQLLIAIRNNTNNKYVASDLTLSQDPAKSKWKLTVLKKVGDTEYYGVQNTVTKKFIKINADDTVGLSDTCDTTNSNCNWVSITKGTTTYKEVPDAK